MESKSGRYRIIHDRFWEDEKIRHLSTANKFAALYLFAGKQVNRLGIYYLSKSLAAEHLSMRSKEFEAILKDLVKLLPWKFDADNNVIYLPTWWDYHEPENPKAMRGFLRDLSSLPNSCLVAEFLSNDRFLTKQFNKNELQYRMSYQGDTVCHTKAIPITITVPVTIETDSSLRSLSPQCQEKTSGTCGDAWPEADLWLLDFLNRQTLLPLPHGVILTHPQWWEKVSVACQGLDLPLLEAEFAKMGAWLDENPQKKPRPVTASYKRFIRSWLERGYDRERRYGYQGKNQATRR